MHKDCSPKRVNIILRYLTQNNNEYGNGMKNYFTVRIACNVYAWAGL